MYVVSCDNFGLEDPFQDAYFGHAMWKPGQYDTSNEKVSTRLHETSMKYSHVNF
jgi:hypothetical protein